MLDIRRIAGTFLGSLLLGISSAEDVDYSQFVNPFIGSEGAISGYACKYRSTHGKRPLILTMSRWRRRYLCGRSRALWHGEARNRYVRGTRKPERT